MKYAFLLAFLSSFSMAANDVMLRVKPGQPGRINDHQIDTTQITPGGKITLQVVVDNLDFTLAGMEFVLQFPSFSPSGGLVKVAPTHADYASSNPPILPHGDWGTTDLLILPVDEAGFGTADHLSLRYGLARFGVVVRNPEERPVGTGSGRMILAEFELSLGNETVPTCISSLADIKLLLCNNGSELCESFVDEQGNLISMNATAADLEVQLVNGQATYLKGDINRDGVLSSQDISPMLQCRWGNLDPCPLTDLSNDLFLQIADMNCSGTVNNQDLLPLIDYVLERGYSSDFKQAPTDPYQYLQNKGLLSLDLNQAAGAMAIIQMEADDPLTKHDINLSGKGSQGWHIMSATGDRDHNLTLILVNASEQDAPLPLANLAYQTDARVLEVTRALVFKADGSANPINLKLKHRDFPKQNREKTIRNTDF